MVLEIPGIPNKLFKNSRATRDGLGNQSEETYPKFETAIESTSEAFDGINNTTYDTLTEMTESFNVEKKGQFLILFECELEYLSETILDEAGCDIAIFDGTTNLREKHQNIFLYDEEIRPLGTGSNGYINSFSIQKLQTLEEGNHTITIQGKRGSSTRYGTNKRSLIIIKIGSSE